VSWFVYEMVRYRRERCFGKIYVVSKAAFSRSEAVNLGILQVKGNHQILQGNHQMLSQNPKSEPNPKVHSSRRGGDLQIYQYSDWVSCCYAV
jgi:hypothetical protein